VKASRADVSAGRAKAAVNEQNNTLCGLLASSLKSVCCQFQVSSLLTAGTQAERPRLLDSVLFKRH
jgi:hypothetical protein